MGETKKYRVDRKDGYGRTGNDRRGDSVSDDVKKECLELAWGSTRSKPWEITLASVRGREKENQLLVL